MQIIEGIRLVVNFIKAKVGERAVIAEDVISYNTEKALDPLDLVYRSYVEDLVAGMSYGKSLIQASGLTVVVWDSIATDEHGDPNINEATYFDLYGDYPRAITCYVFDEIDSYVLSQVSTRKLSNGNFEIDGTGLSDFKIVIS